MATSKLCCVKALTPMQIVRSNKACDCLFLSLSPLCSGYCGVNRCFCDRGYTGPYCTISKLPGGGGGTSAAAGSRALLARTALLLTAAVGSAISLVMI